MKKRLILSITGMLLFLSAVVGLALFSPKPKLSAMSGAESVRFIQWKGVEIPDYMKNDKQELGEFIKSNIKRAEEDPNSGDQLPYSYWETYDFALSIIKATNDYYNDPFVRFWYKYGLDKP